MTDETLVKCMKMIAGLIAGIFCLVTLAGAQPRNAGSPETAWNLIWSDEFDSTLINSSNWAYETGGGGWGNSELENYTARPQNAVVQDGALMIIARKESYGGNSYTSARLKTQGLRSFTYGRIEARLRLPAGQGLWPAFWMLGSSITQVGWPKCGEVDIVEHIDNASTMNGTMHWDNNGHVQYGGTSACDVTQYHVYSVEWSSASITWFVDGSQYVQANIANNINSTDEFHAPFFIILNLAVGGNWPGNPDGSTPFPDTMFVDYVRVYQPATTALESEPGGQMPGRFVLLQNYPNPFNPSTTIRYGLPRRASVKISLYNTLGQTALQVDEGVKEAGYHQVKIDAKNLPSGLYFYRLNAGGYVETRRMLILR